jgi:predicted dinucleotide-binding enzyme
MLFTLRAVLNCKIGSPQGAAACGDIVLVAIPLNSYASVPVAPLEGKIVIDANNDYPERDGDIGELDRDVTTTSELLARHFPKSKIVKALNAIEVPGIEQLGHLPSSSERRAHLIAGDDPAARQVVADLRNQFGCDVIDAGPARGRPSLSETHASLLRPFQCERPASGAGQSRVAITRKRGSAVPSAAHDGRQCRRYRQIFGESCLAPVSRATRKCPQLTTPRLSTHRSWGYGTEYRRHTCHCGGCGFPRRDRDRSGE